MRPGILRAYALGVFTGSLVTATLTILATPAKADVPDSAVAEYSVPVCMTLDDYPSIAGLLGIGKGLMSYGWTAREAGEIAAASIIEVCPEYIPLLRQFVATYGGNQAEVVA